MLVNTIYNASITHLLSRFAPSPCDHMGNLPQPKGNRHPWARSEATEQMRDRCMIDA